MTRLIHPTRVVIIGAGNVGATCAYVLLLRGFAAEIVLIDVNHDKAVREAMDLNHTVPFAHPTRIWAGNYTDCAGAAVTIITAGAAQDNTFPQTAYYLIPYDVVKTNVRKSALRADDFAAAIAELDPKRLLVMLDCCHAAGMGVKDLANSVLTPFTIPPEWLLDAQKAKVIGGVGGKDIDEGLLLQGNGRAILNACQPDERSYIRKDGAMSIFTYHIFEAPSVPRTSLDRGPVCHRCRTIGLCLASGSAQRAARVSTSPAPRRATQRELPHRSTLGWRRRPGRKGFAFSIGTLAANKGVRELGRPGDDTITSRLWADDSSQFKSCLGLTQDA